MAESGSYHLVESGDFTDLRPYECRIIIVGKTGNGKSTLGNKLVGRHNVAQDDTVGQAQQGFGVARWFDAGTKWSQIQTGTGTMAGNEVTLKVVDTPGLFDPSEDLKYTIIEVTRSLSLCCPGGPHAIVFVIRCDVRFTGEEEEAFDEIIKLFGDCVKDHLIVVFTHGDTLGGTPIEALLSNTQAKGLKKVVELIGNRYVVFSNTPGRQDIEVRHLLGKINEVSVSCTRHYTDATLAKLTLRIEREILKLIQSRGLTRKQAILEVRKIIVASDETNEFYTGLLKVIAGSALLGIIVGVTGGLALPAAMMVEGAGMTLGGVTFLTSIVVCVKEKISKRKNEGKKCTIL